MFDEIITKGVVHVEGYITLMTSNRRVRYYCHHHRHQPLITTIFNSIPIPITHLSRHPHPRRHIHRPCLAISWANLVHTQIFLTRDGSAGRDESQLRRHIYVARAPHLPNTDIPFFIDNNGIITLNYCLCLMILFLITICVKTKGIHSFDEAEDQPSNKRQKTRP